MLGEHFFPYFGLRAGEVCLGGGLGEIHAGCQIFLDFGELSAVEKVTAVFFQNGGGVDSHDGVEFEEVGGVVFLKKVKDFLYIKQVGESGAWTAQYILKKGSKSFVVLEFHIGNPRAL